VRVMRRVVTFALAFLAATQAMASFELVMVLDRGAGKIHRFDGVTGAYFGSFGTFSGSVKSMSLDQATGRVMVFDPLVATVSQWDYSTGMRTRSFSSATGATFYGYGYGGTILAGTATTVDILDGNSLQGVGGYAVAGGNPNSVVRWNGQYVTFGGGVQRNDANGNYLGGGSGFGAANAGVVANAPQGPAAIWAAPNATNGLLSFMSSNLGTGLGITFNSMLTGNIYLGSAHDGFYAVGKNPANTAVGRVAAYGFGLQSARIVPFHSFGENVIKDPVAIATVVAPEPGTMLLLGGGLAALAARRRDRARRPSRG